MLEKIESTWRILSLVLLLSTCQASPAAEKPSPSNEATAVVAKPSKSQGWNVLKVIKNVCYKAKDLFVAATGGIFSNIYYRTGEKNPIRSKSRRCSRCNKPKKGQVCREMHPMQQYPTLPAGQTYPPQGYHSTAYVYPPQYYTGPPYYPPHAAGAPYPPHYYNQQQRPPPQRPYQPPPRYEPPTYSGSSTYRPSSGSGSRSTFCCCFIDVDTESTTATPTDPNDSGCFWKCLDSLCDPDCCDGSGDLGDLGDMGDGGD